MPDVMSDLAPRIARGALEPVRIIRRWRARSGLNGVRVASPCGASWEGMRGDDKVRFCGHCQLNVYNLSAMDVEEAAEIIARDDDRLCIRFFRRPDGTVLTRDCPVGVRLAELERRRAVIRVGATGLVCVAAATFFLMPTQGARASVASRRASLISSIQTGDIRQANAILDAGISVDARLGGRTLLMVAAMNGQSDAALLLVLRGADVNAADREGKTALRLAKECGHPELAKLLRKYGAMR